MGRRRFHHTHGCIACKVRIACTAPYVDNYDGSPERYCSAIDPDEEQRFVCEDCEAQGLCDSGAAEDCAIVGTRELVVEYLPKPLWLCEACYAYETDPDRLQAEAEEARR